jgi:flavin reductase (DIM6/NTAB) family NADH-FMN oxidoreductase RutF
VSESLASLPLPVAVVAAAVGSERSCSTGTMTYVSYSPPLVAAPLSTASRTLSLVRQSNAFSLSLLADDQAEVAVRAARPSDRDTFAEHEVPLLDHERGPAVAGAALVLWCALESVADAGSSVLCIGRVEGSLTGAREPLLRFGRRYRTLGDAREVVEEARYPL